jgi:hypothetical protein
MNMDDKITKNYNRVVEMAPEIETISPAPTNNSVSYLSHGDFKKAISLAYLVGVLDGGQEVKEAMYILSARNRR